MTDLIKRAEELLQKDIQILREALDKVIVEAMVAGYESKYAVGTYTSSRGFPEDRQIYYTLSKLERNFPHLYAKLVSDYANDMTPRVLIKKDTTAVMGTTYKEDCFMIALLDNVVLLK